MAETMRVIPFGDDTVQVDAKAGRVLMAWSHKGQTVSQEFDPSYVRAMAAHMRLALQVLLDALCEAADEARE